MVITIERQSRQTQLISKVAQGKYISPRLLQENSNEFERLRFRQMF